MGDPLVMMLVGLIMILVLLIGAILSQPVNPQPKPSGPGKKVTERGAAEIITISLMNSIPLGKESRKEALWLTEDLSRMLSEELSELHPGIVMNFVDLGDTLGFRVLNQDGSEPYDVNKSISIRYPA